VRFQEQECVILLLHCPQADPLGVRLHDEDVELQEELLNQKSDRSWITVILSTA
jgi:hypothetical protein